MKSKVQVWVYRKPLGKDHLVLLLKTTKERGSFWQPITGSVEPGESIQDAACRELVEETGFELDSPVKVKSLGFKFRFQSRWGEAEEHGFAVEVESSQVEVKMDPSEHQDFRWVSPTEALSLLKYDSNRDCLRILIKKGNQS